MRTATQLVNRLTRQVRNAKIVRKRLKESSQVLDTKRPARRDLDIYYICRHVRIAETSLMRNLISAAQQHEWALLRFMTSEPAVPSNADCGSLVFSVFRHAQGLSGVAGGSAQSA